MMLRISINAVLKYSIGILYFVGTICIFPYAGFIPLAGVALWVADSSAAEPVPLWAILATIFVVLWLLGAIITVFIPPLCLVSQRLCKLTKKHLQWLLIISILFFVIPFFVFELLTLEQTFLYFKS
jgi:hypothetical protein